MVCNSLRRSRLQYITLIRLLLLLISSCTNTCYSQEPIDIDYDLEKFSNISINYRTNVCDRQIALTNDEIELRDALRGLELSIAFINYNDVPNQDQLFAINETNGTYKRSPIDNYPGLFVVLVEELARRAGFTWQYAAFDPLIASRTSSITTNISIDNNKTWTDLLEWQVQHFDIAADFWERTDERMEREISFPKGSDSGNIILVTSKQFINGNDDDVVIWSFLSPFEWTVWLAVIGMMFFTALVYYLLERLNPESDSSDLEIKPWVSIYKTSICLTGHFHFRPNTHAARLASFSWTFFTLILATSYTANLASFLVSRNHHVDDRKPINTLRDAVIEAVPVCVLRNTPIDEFVRKKYPGMIVVQYDTELDMYKALWKQLYGSDGGCAVALSSLAAFELYKLQSEVNSDCSLTTQGRTVLNFPSGMATAFDTGEYCTSLISHVLNLHFQEMEASGFMRRAWKRYVARITTKTTSCDNDIDDINNNVTTSSSFSSSSIRNNTGIPEEENYSLGPADMAGIFMLHGSFTLIAILLSMWDYYYSIFFPQQQQQDVILDKSTGSENDRNSSSNNDSKVSNQDDKSSDEKEEKDKIDNDDDIDDKSNDLKEFDCNHDDNSHEDFDNEDNDEGKENLEVK